MKVSFFGLNQPYNGTLSVSVMVNGVCHVLDATLVALHALGYNSARMTPSDWEYLASRYVATFSSLPSKIPPITTENSQGLPGPRDWVVNGHAIRIDGAQLIVDDRLFSADQVQVGYGPGGLFVSPGFEPGRPGNIRLQLGSDTVELPYANPASLECRDAVEEWLDQNS